MTMVLPSPDIVASVDSKLAASSVTVSSESRPTKPFCWGQSSTAATDVAATNSKNKSTGYAKARKLAAIMAEETETREAALAVYSDQGKSFVEIEAEQARLLQELLSSSLSPRPSSSSSTPQTLEHRAEVRPESQHHPQGREAHQTTSPTSSARSRESSDVNADILTEARNFLSDQELEEIEKALRDEEPALSSPPPAAAAAAAVASRPTPTDGFLSGEEVAAIEAALREADAREEEASVQMALALQEQELGNLRHPERKLNPQGNVRTMTRAELEFESLRLADAYGPYSSTSSGTLSHVGPHSALDDEAYVDESVGFRMNSTLAQEWVRRDRNTIVGPNNEIRSKHDVHVQGQANAQYLGLEENDFGLRTHVGNQAFNSFKNNLKRTTKGVATHGTGRAGTDSDAVKGKAMDPHVRLQISKAINSGLIERCNGEVKQGKEAVVYHAEQGAQSHGYDVAVKVFKRITEFKGRGAYVDGDPRYFGQAFRKNSDREQVEIWAEKEYRNLLRANRSRVPVPTPLHCTENIIFMRFMGNNGWPAPQIREIEMRNGSKKWDVLYSQCMEAIRR